MVSQTLDNKQWRTIFQEKGDKVSAPLLWWRSLQTAAQERKTQTETRSLAQVGRQFRSTQMARRLWGRGLKRRVLHTLRERSISEALWSSLLSSCQRTDLCISERKLSEARQQPPEMSRQSNFWNSQVWEELLFLAGKRDLRIRTQNPPKGLPCSNGANSGLDQWLPWIFPNNA